MQNQQIEFYTKQRLVSSLNFNQVKVKACVRFMGQNKTYLCLG